MEYIKNTLKFLINPFKISLLTDKINRRWAILNIMILSIFQAIYVNLSTRYLLKNPKYLSNIVYLPSDYSSGAFISLFSNIVAVSSFFSYILMWMIITSISYFLMRIIKIRISYTKLLYLSSLSMLPISFHAVFGMIIYLFNPQFLFVNIFSNYPIIQLILVLSKVWFLIIFTVFIKVIYSISWPKSIFIPIISFIGYRLVFNN